MVNHGHHNIKPPVGHRCQTPWQLSEDQTQLDPSRGVLEGVPTGPEPSHVGATRALLNQAVTRESEESGH